METKFLESSGLQTYSAMIAIKKQPPQVFYKKDGLKILQDSQENTYVGVSFLITLQA